jgi:hypothetical protein
MKSSNPKREAIVAALAFALGTAIGAALAGYFHGWGENYSILIMNPHMALRIDKRTGQTWSMDFQDGFWQPVEVKKDGKPWLSH